MSSVTLATKEPLPMMPEPLEHSALRKTIEAVCGRIAPLWPLKNFVAVNPFLGFTSQNFAETCASFERVASARMLMPRQFYKAALEAGQIDDEALAVALAARPIDGVRTTAELKARLAASEENGSPSADRVATLAEVLDQVDGQARPISLVGFMIDDISSFLSSYFDEGQAIWRLPLRDKRPYPAWRATVLYDRNAEAAGIRDFRRNILSLPDEPIEAIAQVLKELGMPQTAAADYLFRALFDVGGWAAYARYLGWNAELNGERDDTLLHVLAIRVAYGFGLYKGRTDQAFLSAWKKAMEQAASLPSPGQTGVGAHLAVDLVLHEAYEIMYRRKLISQLKLNPVARSLVRDGMPPRVQTAFCIDVRSEIFRRALETVSADIETIGFAGFFGFPVEYVPLGQHRSNPQCPVLLRPSFTVCEAVKNTSEDEQTEIIGLRLMRRRAAKAMKAFKLSAVSSFGFVETTGLGYAVKLVTDSAGLTRPVPSPSADGLDGSMARRLAPRINAGSVGTKATGFRRDQRVDMAEAVLKAMSLTGPFGSLVLLVGHGSTTVNNPHASGLDCGACGGHTGEANARIAAAILNDPDVREGLVSRGIKIPEDTLFIGALHNTTTDEVTLFDEDDIPHSFAMDVAVVKDWLLKAAEIARRQRSTLLGIPDNRETGTAVKARSRDWSQVRPEWGLAGNAAFIAAPRSLTRGLDLGGRSFLHSYEAAQDEGYKVLELIMTAPMVVASWINLQYFGSTVNNAAFGSGNKVLHNVVGQIGVLEGNAGDLRVGLPLQSVHDGQRFVHEPRRLNVFIAAPEAAMDQILARHEGVRNLVVNAWVHLHAISSDTNTVTRCASVGRWEAV